ncbi:MAG: DUF2971 domain-containing protein [Cyclobacteriaceae bacterium]
MTKAKNETPDILYHYTSVDTLLKIIENGQAEKVCFRATNINFFNDPQEYTLAISLLKQSMIQYEKIKSIKNPKSKQANWKSISNLSNLSGTPFLLSLSLNPDNLAMWRNYGANGKGVAIGIEYDKIIKYTQAESVYNTSLVKCHYSKDIIISSLISYWESNYDEIDFTDKGKTVNFYNTNFLFDLSSLCFTIKNNEYSYEDEWRLCKNEYKAEEIKFREKNGIIVPFIEHFFEKGIIKEIVVGPCVNKDLTKKSIEFLLKKRKFQIPEDSIVLSKVQYRTF